MINANLRINFIDTRQSKMYCSLESSREKMLLVI